MPTRDRVVSLVSAIPEDELVIVERMLRGLVPVEGDPFLAALAAAPEDDEPETEEERAEVARAWEEVKRGETIPYEEVMRNARAQR